MKKRILLLAVFAVVLNSCTDETIIYEDPNESLILEGNQSILSNSVNFDESGVLDIFQDDALKASSKSNGIDADQYPLTLVANISVPSYQQATELAATHIDMDGDYLYVSYNTAGDVYAGGVDVVDISNALQPRLTSRLYYVNADINSLKYDNGFIYAVGGVDSEQSVTATSNSFIGKIPVSNGRMDISGGISYGFQEGLSANDLIINQNGLFVSSGRNGYLTHYNKNSLELISEVSYEDLRFIIEMDSQLAVLDASYGVRYIDDNLQQIGGFPVSNGDFREADKRTISQFENRISVAEGRNGAGIYNLQTGAFEKYMPILLNPEDASQSEVVTNSVTFNEDVFLMANGGAGLAISENGNDVNQVGVIELSGSINHVVSKGDFIFAASGRSGLQIIKMNRPTESLESACSNATRYPGGNNLEVTPNQDLDYSGSYYFRTLNVSGELLLCGTWSVRNEFTVLEGGLLEVSGTIYNGRNNRRRNLVVEDNATLRVEGNIVVYGDLILGENSKVEFVGNNNNAYIYGNVNQAESTAVNGTFNDYFNKF